MEKDRKISVYVEKNLSAGFNTINTMEILETIARIKLNKEKGIDGFMELEAESYSFKQLVLE
jgi:hypothetical protein